MPSDDPVIVRTHLNGRDIWRASNGWSAPVIAGADGEGEGGEPVSTPEGTFVPPEPVAAPEGKADPDAGAKTALTAERTARKAAEKQARDSAARLKELEDASLTETERYKREAEEGNAKAASASGKLQKANLLGALTDLGFAGSKAKAVSRLLDALEYDDDDEPVNLPARLKAAEKEYGDLVKATPTTTDFDGGARKPATANSMDDQIRRMAGRQ